MKICWKQVWSNAVRKKVQTADKNITIIHNTTPLINECLAKQKAEVLLSIKTFWTFNETSRLKIYAQFKHCLQVKTNTFLMSFWYIVWFSSLTWMSNIVMISFQGKRPVPASRHVHYRKRSPHSNTESQAGRSHEILQSSDWESLF